MAEFITIQADLDEAMEFFDSLDKGQKKIRRHILAGVGTAAKNRVKKSYKNYLKKQTGALYKSIVRKVIRNGEAVLIEANERNEDRVLYGYALAKGSKITAKASDYLTFQIDGKWVKVHEVQLKEHKFITSPVNDYMKSPELKQQLDRLAQKEIDKLEKKGITV